MQLQRHARPRRDRGQHPSGARLGRARRAHRRSSTRPRVETRLSTEKFMLDGRHTGTGGGNHFVLGGATPADSPVPAPARSAAQPARCTGTTIRRCRTCSRAVHRPDEPGAARRRGAQRLASTSSRSRSSEIAAPPRERRPGRRRPGWSTALLRNLLVDVTGNTHRAEFCIDKLYSPDGPTGRLGLLELRAFEMPPHARMSLAQQLLMRALVARFWQHAVPARALDALGHRAARPLHAAALRLDATSTT